jgi:hypothetical protein
MAMFNKLIGEKLSAIDRFRFPSKASSVRVKVRDRIRVRVRVKVRVTVRVSVIVSVVVIVNGYD